VNPDLGTGDEQVVQNASGTAVNCNETTMNKNERQPSPMYASIVGVHSCSLVFIVVRFFTAPKAGWSYPVHLGAVDDDRDVYVFR
jgi:hypothetical protein